MARQEEIKQYLNEIRNHFEKNLNNKYVKNILLKLELPADIKHDMNIILDFKTLYFDSRGSIDDIYNSIQAITYFIKEIRARVLSNIYSYTGSIFFTSNPSKDPNDDILFQMAIKNYAMNIKILAKMIYTLLEMVIEYDEENFTDKPAYKHTKNLDEILIYLKEIMSEDEKKHP